MINYFQDLIFSGRLFTLRPPVMQVKTIIILAVFFGLCVALGLACKVLVKKTRDGLKIKSLRQLFYLFVAMGILGFVYLFFAWQKITLLAGRFWLLIWLVTVIIWLGVIGRYMFFKAPKIRNEIEEKRKFEKYVP